MSNITPRAASVRKNPSPVRSMMIGLQLGALNLPIGQTVAELRQGSGGMTGQAAGYSPEIIEINKQGGFAIAIAHAKLLFYPSAKE
jgi:hypothetical protein